MLVNPCLCSTWTITVFLSFIGGKQKTKAWFLLKEFAPQVFQLTSSKEEVVGSQVWVFRSCSQDNPSHHYTITCYTCILIYYTHRCLITLRKSFAPLYIYMSLYIKCTAKTKGKIYLTSPYNPSPPLRLGGHRVSAWLHLLLNTTTALQLFTLFFEHSHFFAEVGCYLFAQVAHSFTLCSSSPPHFVEHRTCVMQTSTEFVFFSNSMAKRYIQVFVEQEHISGKMHHSNWRSGTRAGQWLNLTWSALILIWASGGRPPLNCIMVRRSECPARII